MRSVDFVPAKGVEINVKSFDVDGSVGCISDAIDAEEGTGDGVDEVGNGAEGGNAAEDIGGVGAGYETRVGVEER